MRIEEPLIHESALIHKVIVRFLEDYEDLKLAKKALKNMKSTKSLAQLRKELELDN